MTRWLCALTIVTAMTSAGADEPKPASPAIVPAKNLAKPLTAEILIAKLAERVDVERAWTGTLEQALDHMTSQLGIPVSLDFVSFKLSDPPIENAGEYQVQIEKARQQPFRLLFERMLRPVDGVLLLREDHYEVAARQVASRNADPEYGPYEDTNAWPFPKGPQFYPTIPIVHVIAEKRSMEEVLRELAITAEQNIVLAPQAGEKGKNPITARMLNVRFEIALNLLADMADLRVVKRGNVWLLTSKTHAANLAASPTAPKEPRLSVNPARRRAPTPASDLHVLLHDLVALQIVEQQRRIAIMKPEQQVEDHDRLEKLENAVRELTDREKMRRIRERQQPGASPFDPNPKPADAKP